MILHRSYITGIAWPSCFRKDIYTVALSVWKLLTNGWIYATIFDLCSRFHVIVLNVLGHISHSLDRNGEWVTNIRRPHGYSQQWIPNYVFYWWFTGFYLFPAGITAAIGSNNSDSPHHVGSAHQLYFHDPDVFVFDYGLSGNAWRHGRESRTDSVRRILDGFRAWTWRMMHWVIHENRNWYSDLYLNGVFKLLKVRRRSRNTFFMDWYDQEELKIVLYVFNG